MRAQAIVMPMSPGAGFGGTLQTVLRERPCRVIIESAPTTPKRKPTPIAA
jgi:basic amino acid/polyamine antiporter, APA family